MFDHVTPTQFFRCIATAHYPLALSFDVKQKMEQMPDEVMIVLLNQTSTIYFTCSKPFFSPKMNEKTNCRLECPIYSSSSTPTHHNLKQMVKKIVLAMFRSIYFFCFGGLTLTLFFMLQPGCWFFWQIDQAHFRTKIKQVIHCGTFSDQKTNLLKINKSWLLKKQFSQS